MTLSIARGATAAPASDPAAARRAAEADLWARYRADARTRTARAARLRWPECRPSDTTSKGGVA